MSARKQYSKVKQGWEGLVEWESFVGLKVFWWNGMHYVFIPDELHNLFFKSCFWYLSFSIKNFQTYGPIFPITGSQRKTGWTIVQGSSKSTIKCFQLFCFIFSDWNRTWDREKVVLFSFRFALYTWYKFRPFGALSRDKITLTWRYPTRLFQGKKKRIRKTKRLILDSIIWFPGSDYPLDFPTT